MLRLNMMSLLSTALSSVASADDFAGDDMQLSLLQVSAKPHKTSITAEQPPMDYVGCFVDDGARDLNQGPKAYGYTSESCKQACNGFTYFALQNNGWCVCDNQYSRAPQYRKVGDNECGGVCAGEAGLQPARYCGAGWRNAVYGVADAVEEEPEPVEDDVADAVADPHVSTIYGHKYDLEGKHLKHTASLISQAPIVTQADCVNAAEALGLELGGEGFDFVGGYGTKGCYTYSSGNFGCHVYYGTDGGDVSAAQAASPVTNGAQTRLVGYDPTAQCGPPPTTTTAPRMCCRAFSANCLACAAGVSEEEYCEQRPEVPGCPQPQDDEADAVGDPHITTNTGKHFDLQ